MSTKQVFTGLLDLHLERIYEGDLLWTGMRRNSPVKGWTLEKVVRGSGDDPWLLADLETGEKMQMQWDQMLRGKVKPT
jgi:hypothetical protein